MGRWITGERAKSSWIVDKCGEVVGLNVERTIGMQSRARLTIPT